MSLPRDQHSVPADLGQSDRETFASLFERAISRRSALALGIGGLIATLPAAAAAQEVPAPRPEKTFEPLRDPDQTRVQVPRGYRHQVLLRWGDPLSADAPAFDPAHITAAAQAQQFGFNNDYVGFLPLPLGSQTSDHGLLCVSSEVVHPNMMFNDWRGPALATRAQCDAMIAAHGLNVVEVRRDDKGVWTYARDSALNRRVTAASPIGISGPAAGHTRMRTSGDPDGKRVLGTLYNCSGGLTPWGTWLQAEEGFSVFFGGSVVRIKDDYCMAGLQRYGAAVSTAFGWERFHSRFDFGAEPHEIHRFGWIVETDPYDPTARPVKRTALGRMFHEAATSVVSPRDGRVTVYTGDDGYFEHVYKFVTRDSFDPADRKKNMGLLDHGTLYAARFDDEGKGTWLPLVHGEGPLTKANGYADQGDVLIRTRQAATLLGATPMDRPEDIQASPATGAVYIALTANVLRGAERRDAANPRAPNRHGHIIELREAGGDCGATDFAWEIFLTCGPIDAGGDYQGQERAMPFASPDNLAFDRTGNLWVATDGQPATMGCNDGVYVVPTSGGERGRVRHFLSAVPGAEVCGPSFTPDGTTFFCALQHPGRSTTASSFSTPSSRFPDYDEKIPPRASVIAVSRDDGGAVGT